MTLALKIATTTKTFPHDSGSWCCITIPKLWQNVLWFRIAIPNLVTKCSVIQTISSGQTFTDILNLWCDLDLEHSNPIFPHDTAAYDAVLSNQFGCNTTSSLEDTTKIVIFWLYKPSLWPWHWTQWTNFSAWYWLIMLHDHTRFGDKMFCGSEDIVWANIHSHFKLSLWPWPWMQ